MIFMELITKKKFIDTMKEIKEIYFIGCVNSAKYTLEQLKKIIDGATHEQLTVNKRYITKVNDYQMVTDNGELNYLQFKPFDRYYKDNNTYYVVGEIETLIYYIDEE